MGKNNRNEYPLNGLLDKGSSFEGKLMFDGTVQINGDFKGEILSDGALVVGQEAQISARIQVDTLIVDGSVQGEIEAKKKVELHRGSRLIANIVTPTLVIEEGAIFQGQCQMIEDARPAQAMHRDSQVEPLLVEEGEDSLMM